MKRMLLPVIATCIASAVATANGMGTGVEGCSSNCASCHSIKREEAIKLIQPLDPAIDVFEAGPAPVRGLFQARIRKGKDEGVIYIDYGKKFLLNGSIIDTGNKTDITQQDLQERKRIDPAAIRTDNALVLGNPSGSRKIHLFTDPDCPYCARLHKELLQLVKDDPGLRVDIILFPLAIHPAAAAKVDSIVCQSKSSMSEALAMLDLSFEKKEIKALNCGSSYAASGTRQADELGIGVTPTIVLPDGRLVMGMKTAAELKKLLAEKVATTSESSK